jgi:predicted transcriptional regulator
VETGFAKFITCKKIYTNMKPAIHTQLSRRESQIMDAVYRLGQATVHEVVAEMDDPPGYNSVRVTLGILEEKGHLSHEKNGKRFVYRPRQPQVKAGRDATAHLLKTFFSNSAPRAVATLLDLNESSLSDDDLDELADLVQGARNKRGQE